MLKHLIFKLIQYRVKSFLPLINKNLYSKLFTLSYKFFTFIKPSQMWVIVLALLNKTEFQNLIKIPSILMLFRTFFSDSSTNSSNLNEKILFEKLEINKFTDSQNNWENFFWVLIILALIKRFTVTFFKLLWIPFKIALIYLVLKHLGFDFSYAYNVLNTLSLGIIDWFYDKLTSFLDLFNKNDKNS